MITSTHNPKIQAVKKLLGQARERREAGSFVAEGVRLVEEGGAADWPATLVLYTEGLSPRGEQVVRQLAGSGAEVEQVAQFVLDSVTDTEATQGILAVFAARTLPIPADLNFVVIADAIRDPGNLGTFLRTAAAAGVQAALLTPGTADAFAPKVLRAGMGAHFRLPIHRLDWPAIEHLLKTRPLPIEAYLADSSEGIPCWQADLRQPCALIIGGESEGAGPEAQQLASSRLIIPMPGRSESLNVAVAAAVLLFEVVRQRASK